MARTMGCLPNRTARTGAFLVAVASGVFLLLWAPSARADCLPGAGCPPAVSAPSAPLPTPVPSDPVNQVGNAVVGAANQAQQAAGSATDQVTGTIDYILHPGGGGGGGGGGGTGGGSGGSSGGGSKGDGPSSTGTPAGAGPSAGSGGSVTSTSPSGGQLQGRAGGTSRQGLLHRLGGAVARAANELKFPLALAVLVLLFAIVQDRLDRNDPKLALAPVAPDVVRFE